MNLVDKKYALLMMALIVCFLGVTTLHGEDFGKVMPLGDSITWGASTPGGYRDPLYQLLIAAGHTLRYVGTAGTNSTPLLVSDAQQYHQGMSGWVISTGAGRDGLYEYITGWMALADPDVILLMIGTNDCGLNYDIPNVHIRLDALVERIFTNKPSVRLLLVTVVPSADSGTEANVVILNAQIPAIAAKHQALGRNIQLVPMHDALNASTDLLDALHPDRGGYHKMATTCFESMTAGIPPESGSSHIVLSGQSTSGPAGSGAEGTYAIDIVTDDLISESSPALVSWSRGDVYFELNTLNDGGYDGSGVYGGTYVSETFNEGYLPCTYTYELDTSLSPYGYDLTEIRTCAGYAGNGSCLANQKYALLVKYVDNPDFVFIGKYNYSPFSSSDSDPVAATKVTLMSNTGTIASGVSHVRFVLLDHGQARGQYDGSIYQEIDVLGEPSSPDPALVARWQFNDIGGSTTADTSGNGYDGQLMNMDATNWTLGKRCGGLAFDGIDDYVEVVDDGDLDVNANSWSVAFWTKSDAASQGTFMISKRATVTPFIQYSIGLSAGNSYTWAAGSKLTFLFREATGIEKGGYTTADVDFSDWTYVCVVLDRAVNTVYVYINGVLVGITLDHNGSLPTINNTRPLYIGGNPGAFLYYRGLIDEVEIYNYALAAGQIHALYQQDALVGDLEPDGDVDLNDFAILADYWQNTETCDGDLTCDCTADIDDLIVLLDEWLYSI